MKKLTFTMENYLEAIFELSDKGSGVRLSDIAGRLGVRKATANSAMSTLSEQGLIVNQKYGEIFLTPSGSEMAEFISKKHHIIQQFFTDILKIDASIADSDACAIEHVISDNSIHAMQDFLQKYKGAK